MDILVKISVYNVLQPKILHKVYFMVLIQFVFTINTRPQTKHTTHTRYYDIKGSRVGKVSRS